MKLTKDEHGLAGVAEVGLIGILLVVIVFAGTRVYNATHSADQANQEAIKVSETSPDFKEVDKLEEEKKEVEEPKEDEKPTAVAVTEDKPKPVEQTDKKKEEDKPDWINLGNANVVDNGGSFTFSANLGASRSGWCKVKAYKQENYVHVEGDEFSNKTSCSITISKDEFELDGTWEGYVKFYSSDGKVYGATETFELVIGD